MPELAFYALLCCDRVIVENNGKKGLIGVFTQFNFPQVPASPLPWFVYASVGNLDEGTHNFSLNLAHDDSQSVVFSMGGELSVVKTREEVDIIVPVGGITFPKSGTYSLTLNIDAYPAGSKVLRVRAIEGGGRT